MKKTVIRNCATIVMLIIASIMTERQILMSILAGIIYIMFDCMDKEE